MRGRIKRNATEGGNRRKASKGDFHFVGEDRRYQVEEKRKRDEKGNEAARKGEARKSEARQEGTREGEGAGEAG